MTDPRRLARALLLDAERCGNGWLVSGGASAWFVDDATGCCCPDRQIRGPGCKHELRVELAKLAPAVLAGFRALLGGHRDTAPPEIVRPGQPYGAVFALRRSVEPGLPLEAFQPPLRTQRRRAPRPRPGKPGVAT